MGWTDKHLKDIRTCVNDPIGNTWWHSAEEPWQFLAACIELVSALDSPDPSNYWSGVPVQQDGSCNGLQHYAALGGDVQGAKQVNLSPSNSPQDVYAAVARLVEARIAKDVERGNNPMAVSLSGRVTRKIIKQPVMTSVYGVTPYGARLQILARLREGNVLPAAQLEAGATYLTQHVMATLKHLFDRAQAIQDWLTRTARDIGRSVSIEFAKEYGYKGDLAILPGDRLFHATPKAVGSLQNSKGTKEKKTHKDNPPFSFPRHSTKLNDKDHHHHAPNTYRYPQTSLTWTTPLGFQICQPYLDPGVKYTKTCLQNSVTIPATPTSDTPVDEGRQTSAFPPNFIHSLDATHMFMTAIACFNYPHARTVQDAKSKDNDHHHHRMMTEEQQQKEEGTEEGKVTFASVHDCFWTHASTVDTMNRILREQFVELYTKPILRDLATELRGMYPNFKIPVVVRRAASHGGKKEEVVAGEVEEELMVMEGEDAGVGLNNNGSKSSAQREQLVKGWIPLVIKDPPERGEFDLREVLRSEYFFS